MGSVEPMKELHARWRGQVQFVDILIRQAHPGPGVRPYLHFDEKLRDAERYQRDAGIPWPVLVDDIEGTTHQVYGGMADPTYLLDVDGRVAYYNMWTYAPTLHEAIEALLRQGGRGVVLGEGIDQVPHLSPAMTEGWRGLQRGLPQSYLDIETAVPGMGTMTWLGYQLRPVLAPVTLRSRPLPAVGLLALAGGLAAGMALGAWAQRRNH